jgi:hypothetical protein
MPFGEKPIGPPERTYHGEIPEVGYRRVLIKEEGLRDAVLQTLDGSPDVNWGYGGGGPARLANALAADAFDDSNYGEAFGWYFKDGLVSQLEMDLPFVVSRDRMVVQGLLEFNNWVREGEVGKGKYFIPVIQELLRKKHDTREKLMSLLSGNALGSLEKSHFGVSGKK